MPCFDHLERKKVLGFINVEPSVISQRAIWENMEWGNEKWSGKKQRQKDLAKDKSALKSFIRNCQTHASMESRC